MQETQKIILQIPRFKLGDAVILSQVGCRDGCEKQDYCGRLGRLGVFRYGWISPFKDIVGNVLYISEVEPPLESCCPKNTYRLSTKPIELQGDTSTVRLTGEPTSVRLSKKTHAIGMWGFNEIWLSPVSFLEDNLFEI